MEARQLKEGAAAAFAKGRFARAAEQYEQYCAAEPRDLQSRLRLGDAWAKAGEKSRAAAAYLAAAEGFARDGFLPRAIAASKLALELAPEHHGVQQMLAGLYAKRRGPGPEVPAGAPPTAARAPSAPRAPEQGGLQVDWSRELPPELQLGQGGPATGAREPEVELELSPSDMVHPGNPEVVRAARAPASSAPPGLAARTSSRIFIPTPVPPGSVAPQAAAAAPAVPPPAGPRPRRDVQAGLQAFSRFTELELELDALTGLEGRSRAPVQSAPAPAPGRTPPAPTQEPRRLRLTEQELEDTSLLRSVEVAAMAAQGGAASDGTDEETVFSITDAVEADAAPLPGQLPHIPLFSDLAPEAFIALFERCPLRRFREGQRILQQGSYGDAFYVICEGRVRVVRMDGGTERELAVLEGGAFFGEVALLSDAPRTASVDSAADDTQLLEISAPVLTELSHRYPAVAQALKKFCRERLLRTVMSTSALFRPFSRKDRKAIVERFRARDVPRGTVLIREGARSDGLYVVLSGEVVVTRDAVTLARLREGEVFGEMSLLHRAPASATVTASRRTSLLRLPREDFDVLTASHPQLLSLVSALSEDRQRQTEALLAAAADEDLMLV